MSIVHTAIAALLVAALSVAYGLKEQTKDLQRTARELDARETELRREIALLEYEWRYATSPDQLIRLSQELFGETALLDAQGAVLAGWAPDQVLRLQPKRRVDPEVDIVTATIPQARPDAGAEVVR